MATNKNITMKQYNGLDYDTLYPKTTPEQVGAVSYEAQTLTDGQKTQARGNIGAGSASELARKPDALLAYTILHVAKTGSDTTGDGREAKPFLTIQKALSSLPRLLLNRVIIRVHEGTYDESVNVASFTGTENLVIQGAAGETVKVRSIRAAYINVGGNLSIENMELTGFVEGIKSSLYIVACTRCVVSHVTCTTAVAAGTTGYGAVRFETTQCVWVDHLTVSNKPIALDVCAATVYLNDTVTGENNTVGIRSGSGYGQHGGFVQKGGASIAGEEQKGYGGQIW